MVQKMIKFDTNGNPSELYAEPVEIQYRGTKIETPHNGVTVAPTNGNSPSAYIEIDGYSQFVFHYKSDASHPASVGVKWSFDKINATVEEQIVTSGTRAGVATLPIDVKAPYAQFILYNTDVAPHNITSTLYLKA